MATGMGAAIRNHLVDGVTIEVLKEVGGGNASEDGAIKNIRI